VAKQVILGTSGDDDLISGVDGDVIIAFAGNDILRSGSGAPGEFYGGLGNDLYVITLADTIIENANEGTDTVETSLGSYMLRANFENLTGTAAFGQSLAGNALNNRITGGAGSDEMQGGTGDDTYVVTIGDTVIEYADEGIDTVEVTSSHVLRANFENLTSTTNTGLSLGGNALNNRITGGAGSDEMVGGLGDDTYVVTSGDTVVEYAGEGTDTIEVGFSHVLRANFENLTSTTNAGLSLGGNALNNRITGGTGNDEMVGGLGDDTYVVRNVGDTIVEAANEGTDTIETTLSSFTLSRTANVENLLALSNAGVTLTGNTLINRIVGGAGNDTLDGNGGVGNDTMVGGLGNDVYVVWHSGDIITEDANAGIDTVQRLSLSDGDSYALPANVENLIVTSSSRLSAIQGNALDNRIAFTHGEVQGGAGNDTYVFDNHFNITIIEAADGGIDAIEISAPTHLVMPDNVENVTLTFAGTDHPHPRVVGNASNNVIIGTLARDDTLGGGAGNDTLTGRGGVDTFVFHEKGDANADQITDFTPGGEKIWLDRTEFTGTSYGWLTASAFVTGTAAQDADDRIIYNSATGWLFHDADGVGAAAQVPFAQISSGLALSASEFFMF
jgi:Ca2+-binding RTX toxin-like protein